MEIDVVAADDAIEAEAELEQQSLQVAKGDGPTLHNPVEDLVQIRHGIRASPSGGEKTDPQF
jgi:hypothetical protein